MAGKRMVLIGAAHGAAIEAGPEWKTVKLYWHQFTQPDWTAAENRVGPLTVESVEGLSWYPNQEDAPFDLWLDDVKLIYE